MLEVLILIVLFAGVYLYARKIQGGARSRSEARVRPEAHGSGASAREAAAGQTQDDDEREEEHAEEGHDYNLEVVGESHYQSALGQIAGKKSYDGAHVEIEAELAPEPTNRHDRNAVVVRIRGQTVGYLSRDNARAFHTWVKRNGIAVPVRCEALITGGWKRKHSEGSYGVRLSLPGFPWQ